MDDERISADPWRALAAELDAWAEAGRVATLWWRDDDAGAWSAPLARLVGLAQATGAPCALAVVPAWLTDETRARILATPDALGVLQHGYAHQNHAPRGQGLGAWELGLHRGAEAARADLRQGRRLLVAAFGAAALPVLVPPWNRIDPALAAELPGLGFRGLSGGREAHLGAASAGLTVANCQADPLKWKGGAAYRGEAKPLAEIVEHLASRRRGPEDEAPPTGIVTHHRDTDAACWAFMERLLRSVGAHPAARWLHAAEIWPGGGP